MEKLQDSKSIKKLVILCMSVYFSSYLTRINFAAIIVELLATGNYSKTDVSTVTTIAFITYGTGQLISGYVSDRFQPRLLIYYGFILTVIMNIMMPLVSYNIVLMTVVWGINGFAQAFMWPPISRIMAVALPDSSFVKSVPLIGVSSAIATIVVYLVSPGIINIFNWRYVFFIFAFIAFLVSFIWLFMSRSVLKGISFDKPIKKIKEKHSNSNTAYTHILIKLLPVIVFTIAIQGMIRDGISTWVPTLVCEQFNIKSSSSILSGVALPIFHIISSYLSYKILKLFKNKVFCSIVFLFSTIALCLLLVYLTKMSNMYVTLLFIGISSGLINGVNLYQTCYIPKYFEGVGAVATISGLMNFSTYIGSAVATYFIAYISEKFGWNYTILTWLIFAVLGAVITVFIMLKAEKDKRIIL